MSDCPNCTKLQSKIDDLQDELDSMIDGRRLRNIAEEYAELLAEQGKIPNTPAGKKGFIAGRIVAL